MAFSHEGISVADCASECVQHNECVGFVWSIMADQDQQLDQEQEQEVSSCVGLVLLGHHAGSSSSSSTIVSYSYALVD